MLFLLKVIDEDSADGVLRSKGYELLDFYLLVNENRFLAN